jgi:hypothetical protein
MTGGRGRKEQLLEPIVYYPHENFQESDEEPESPFEMNDWPAMIGKNAILAIPVDVEESIGNMVRTLLKDKDFLDLVKTAVNTKVEETLSPKPTTGSIVYEEIKGREEIEKKYAGKFVAIDTKSKEVVGDGDTLEDALAKARSKTKSKNLYFRKVGKDYLFKV